MRKIEEVESVLKVEGKIRYGHNVEYDWGTATCVVRVKLEMTPDQFKMLHTRDSQGPPAKVRVEFELNV